MPTSRRQPQSTRNGVTEDWKNQIYEESIPLTRNKKGHVKVLRQSNGWSPAVDRISLYESQNQDRMRNEVNLSRKHIGVRGDPNIIRSQNQQRNSPLTFITGSKRHEMNSSNTYNMNKESKYAQDHSYFLSALNTDSQHHYQPEQPYIMSQEPVAFLAGSAQAREMKSAHSYSMNREAKYAQRYSHPTPASTTDPQQLYEQTFSPDDLLGVEERKRLLKSGGLPNTDDMSVPSLFEAQYSRKKPQKSIRKRHSFDDYKEQQQAPNYIPASAAQVRSKSPSARIYSREGGMNVATAQVRSKSPSARIYSTERETNVAQPYTPSEDMISPDDLLGVEERKALLKSGGLPNADSRYEILTTDEMVGVEDRKYSPTPSKSSTKRSSIKGKNCGKSPTDKNRRHAQAASSDREIEYLEMPSLETANTPGRTANKVANTSQEPYDYMYDQNSIDPDDLLGIQDRKNLLKKAGLSRSRSVSLDSRRHGRRARLSRSRSASIDSRKESRSRSVSPASTRSAPARTRKTSSVGSRNSTRRRPRSASPHRSIIASSHRSKSAPPSRSRSVSFQSLTPHETRQRRKRSKSPAKDRKVASAKVSSPATSIYPHAADTVQYPISPDDLLGVEDRKYLLKRGGLPNSDVENSPKPSLFQAATSKESPFKKATQRSISYPPPMQQEENFISPDDLLGVEDRKYLLKTGGLPYSDVEDSPKPARYQAATVKKRPKAEVSHQDKQPQTAAYEENPIEPDDLLSVDDRKFLLRYGGLPNSDRRNSPVPSLFRGSMRGGGRKKTPTRNREGEASPRDREIEYLELPSLAGSQAAKSTKPKRWSAPEQVADHPLSPDDLLGVEDRKLLLKTGGLPYSDSSSVHDIPPAFKAKMNTPVMSHTTRITEGRKRAPNIGNASAYDPGLYEQQLISPDDLLGVEDRKWLLKNGGLPNSDTMRHHYMPVRHRTSRKSPLSERNSYSSRSYLHENSRDRQIDYLEMPELGPKPDPPSHFQPDPPSDPSYDFEQYPITPEDLLGVEDRKRLLRGGGLPDCDSVHSSLPSLFKASMRVGKGKKVRRANKKRHNW